MKRIANIRLTGINPENDQRQVVIYARVSTRNQKDDLQNQVAFLRQFCNAKGIIVDQCIEDYGSGLNYNRKKWNELLNEALSSQEELVQDIVSILHEFSCRLYGLRKYKKQIEKDEDIAKELQDGNQSDRGTES